jgi:hypothetical protein
LFQTSLRSWSDRVLGLLIMLAQQKHSWSQMKLILHILFKNIISMHVSISFRKSVLKLLKYPCHARWSWSEMGGLTTLRPADFPLRFSMAFALFLRKREIRGQRDSRNQ